jgi:hypothetical protein
MAAQCMVFGYEFLRCCQGQAEAMCAQCCPHNSMKMDFIENAKVIDHICVATLM